MTWSVSKLAEFWGRRHGWKQIPTRQTDIGIFLPTFLGREADGFTKRAPGESTARVWETTVDNKRTSVYRSLSRASKLAAPVLTQPRVFRLQTSPSFGCNIPGLGALSYEILIFREKRGNTPLLEFGGGGR